MNKETYYTYLGTNGTLTSRIHLEGIYSVVSYELTADRGMYLTNDNKKFVKSVTVAKDELPNWYEVPEANL